MAVRLLNRLRPLGTSDHHLSQLLKPSRFRHFHEPIASANSSPDFNFRFHSGVAQLSPREPSSSKETPVTLNEAKTGGTNGDGVSVRSSLNPAELAKFSAIAENWRDAEGPYKPLHALNLTRLAFIRSTLCHHFRKDPDSVRPFEGLKFVDVGCGGGILSEVYWW